MLICNREGYFGRSTIVCHTNLCAAQTYVTGPEIFIFSLNNCYFYHFLLCAQQHARPWSGRVVTICTEVGNGECYEVSKRNRKQDHWWKTKFESRPTVKRKISCSLLPPYFCLEYTWLFLSPLIITAHIRNPVLSSWKSCCDSEWSCLKSRDLFGENSYFWAVMFFCSWTESIQPCLWFFFKGLLYRFSAYGF